MTLKINRMDLFPVPVVAIPKPPGFETHQQPLIDLSLQLRRETEGVQVSNQQGFHSSEDLHLRDDPSIQWLVGTILKAATAAKQTVGDTTGRGEPYVAHLWTNIHEAGGYNVAHAHAPCHWSGVFYLLAEDCREGLDPTDPAGSIGFHNPNPAAVAYGVSPQRLLHPRDGSMFLFPGWLLHAVYPHRSNRLRVSMAFNVNYKPRA